MTASRPSKPRACVDLVDLFLCRLVDRGAHAYRDVRSRHQLVEAFGSKGGNLGQGLARKQGGRKFGSDRNRDFDCFRFETSLDRRQSAIEPGEAIADDREGGCNALSGLLLGLLLAGGESFAIGLRFGVRPSAFVFDHCNRRLLAGGEVLVEQVFGHGQIVH